MESDDYKRRIESILAAAPWEHSKSAQQKAERERKAMARAERRTKRPPSRPFEWDEQKIVCKWLTKHGVNFFAPSIEAGGEDVDPVRMSQFRAIGMRSGVPDIVFVTLAADGRPIVLEMKRTKLTESSLSPAQRKWKEIFPAEGWHHLIGFGAEDAKMKVKRLLPKISDGD